ncbi:MAG: hypothetical protein HPY50_10915 [Firmicutes bacterium]|nr:hypothetical protein [Bacillota bacterium]
MEENTGKGQGWRNLVRWLCFIAFGVSVFSDPLDRLNIYSIAFGAVAGLLFGWLFRIFLRTFLGMFDRAFKKQHGKYAIRLAVDRGMLFLVPFAVMLLVANYYLNWSMTIGFISAGILMAGTAAAIEMGKIKEKPELRNTLAASAVSFLFSLLWILSYQALAQAPSFIEGGINLIHSISLGGGGL